MKFKEHDCFKLTKAIPNEDIKVGTVGVVLLINNIKLANYEVEFVGKSGINIGSQMTYSLTEDYMEKINNVNKL